MAKRFVEYDWIRDKAGNDADNRDIEMMQTTEEGKDGAYIWATCVGGFYVFDTWDDYYMWQNQR